MDDTIRLIYPQWQGGDIARWFPRFDPLTVSQGYYLGSMLLEFLAPPTENPVYTVAVTLDNSGRAVTDGVMDRDVIVEQTRSALDILDVAEPARILTLGGECSVSIVPFTYLSARYEGDVAVIWIDAHPDITLPGDDYDGFHAMALSGIMGMGDSTITDMMPAKVPPERILLVGTREWERDEIRQRQHFLGLHHLTPEDAADSPAPVLDWIRSTGASKLMVHFDLDALDPRDLFAAVAPVPHGLSLENVIELINAIADNFDLVALTIAEPMPTVAIRLRDMLSRLPLVR